MVVDPDMTSGHWSEAQRRTIDVTVELFGRHGVSGTSMQMIADVLGVTKAAIFHQFKSKDDLVMAVAEDPVRRLRGAIQAAEAERAPALSRRVLLQQIVDLAVENRGVLSRLNDDPVLTRFLADNEPFRLLMQRLYDLLVGEDPTPRARVRAASALAAVNETATHPLVAELDDSSLRFHLLEVVEELVAADPSTL